jgi:hypothetical protein
VAATDRPGVLTLHPTALRRSGMTPVTVITWTLWHGTLVLVLHPECVVVDPELPCVVMPPTPVAMAFYETGTVCQSWRFIWLCCGFDRRHSVTPLRNVTIPVR